MLNIYLMKQPKNIVLGNDRWFSANFYKKEAVNDKIKELIYCIDKSEFIGGISIKTQDNNILDLTNLSTGCKTAINTYTFTDKVFDVRESGRNALEQILQLSRGNIYMDIPMPMRGSIRNHYRIYGIWPKPMDCSTYGEFFKAFEDWRRE